MKRFFIRGAKILPLIALCFGAFSAQAKQFRIPKNAAEDTDKIMSQKYWDIWNEDVQKKIDADIEANRKADATARRSS